MITLQENFMQNEHQVPPALAAHISSLYWIRCTHIFHRPGGPNSQEHEAFIIKHAGAVVLEL